MITFDIGRQNLAKLIDSQPSSDNNSNEATVRFQIVDLLLEDVLGWSKGMIHVEVHHDEDYSDYEIGNPVQLLIEAKRASKDFKIPSGYKSKLIPISVLCDYSKDTKEALGQALDYCKKRGIQFGAICNGMQFIAFLASRTDAIPPLEGNALVYSSLDDILERFVQFWECFSSPGMAHNYVHTVLKAEMLPPPPEKLSRQLPGYPGYKNRNPAATELQILGGLFIEDIIKNPDLETDFLKNTYCTSGALSQYALVSKEILRARYSSVFEQAGQVTVSQAVGKKGLNPELYQDIVASSMGKRPILLVGDVGSGKTMFIRHLIKVDAVEQLEKAFVLYIDFGAKPALVDELRPYVVSEIERQLRDSYGIDVSENTFVRSVYYVELQRFARGIYCDLQKTNPDKYKEKELEHLESLIRDPDKHLRASITYATKNQRKPVIIFFDNVDQRPTAFQEQVFLIANAIAADWPITTFVALRPETFLFSKTKGSLSGYQPRVFTIEPPRVDQVLAARLTFARRQLEATARFEWMPKGFTLNSQTLLGYIKMLENGFTNNQELIELLDNMSSGNLREALGMVTLFVGSAHVDSNKIVNAIKTGGHYHLALHEFLRAIIFEDHEYFSPSGAGIVNLFDVATNDEKEHFLLTLVLSFIEVHGQVGDTDGFVTRTAIYAFGQSLGFHPTQIDSALIRATATRWRLLQPAPSEPADNASRYRITTAGAYTYKRLLAGFTYVDAMIIDTPIIHPAMRDKIGDAQLLDQRIIRMTSFLQYLDNCWKKIPEKTRVFDWEVIARSLRDDQKKLASLLHMAL